MADENKYNIRIEAGTDFVLPYLWTDDNNVPIDLTGATVQAQLREYPEASDGFDFYCQHNNQGGRIWLTMLNETTAQIPFSTGYYDVHVILADGTRKEPLHGEVKIAPNVTKPIDGTALYMIGVETFDALPTVGILNRLYFCYDDRKVYRWNGSNYIATAVGNGIQRIDFVGHSSPFTDTYRVTFDDGTTWDYQVTAIGIESIDKIGTRGDYLNGFVDTYRIYFSSGGTYDYNIHGGRVVFPRFEIDWETGMLYLTDNFANITFSIDEETGMLYYTH